MISSNDEVRVRQFGIATDILCFTLFSCFLEKSGNEMLELVKANRASF